VLIVALSASRCRRKYEQKTFKGGRTMVQDILNASVAGTDAHTQLQPLDSVELEGRGGNWAAAVGEGVTGFFGGGVAVAVIAGSDAMEGAELGAFGGPWGVAAGAVIGGTAGVVAGLWG
jgi:hypothetical protein